MGGSRIIVAYQLLKPVWEHGVQAKEWQLGLETLQQMPRARLTPDVVSFSAGIHCCAKLRPAHSREFPIWFVGVYN